MSSNNDVYLPTDLAQVDPKSLTGEMLPDGSVGLHVILKSGAVPASPTGGLTNGELRQLPVDTYLLNPTLPAGALNCNANLTNGSTGYYRMYFTTNPAGNYGSATAVTVNDASGVPIAGTITSGVINFTFDYTGNVQGGRTGNVDANVTVVAGNAGSAKPVVATGVLNASKSISISLVAETDRAYS